MGKETEAQRGLIVCSRSHSLCNDRPEVELRSSGCEAGVCTVFPASLTWPGSVMSDFAGVFHIISKPTESSYAPPHYLSPGVLWLPSWLSLQAFPLITWRSYLPSGAWSPWRATGILPPLSTPPQIYGDFFLFKISFLKTYDFVFNLSP